MECVFLDEPTNSRTHGTDTHRLVDGGEVLGRRVMGDRRAHVFHETVLHSIVAGIASACCAYRVAVDVAAAIGPGVVSRRSKSMSWATSRWDAVSWSAFNTNCLTVAWTCAQKCRRSEQVVHIIIRCGISERCHARPQRVGARSLAGEWLRPSGDEAIILAASDVVVSSM